MTPALVFVTEYVSPTDFFAAPARVIEYVAPAPVIAHIGLPSAATHFSVSFDTTSFANPQSSVSAAEASASQVVSSFPSGVERVQQHIVEQIVHVRTPQIQEQIEESVQVEEQIAEGFFSFSGRVCVPVYNQVYQEQIAAEQEF